MFTRFAIAATAAVLAAAIALPASAKPPVRDPAQNSGTMPVPKPTPPVSLPSRPTSGTMNMPSQKPASSSSSKLPSR